MNLEYDTDTTPYDRTPSRSWSTLAVTSIVTLAIATVLAVGLAAGWTRYQHWQADHLNHHVLVEIVRYNLEQGKLVIPPALQDKPAPASSGPGK